MQRLELVVLLCGSSEFAFDTITVISNEFDTLLSYFLVSDFSLLTTMSTCVERVWESDSASCQKSTGATFA